MTEIQAAIKKLPPAGVEELIDWLDDYRDAPHAPAEASSPDTKATAMSTVGEIEAVIKKLSPAEVDKLADWLLGYHLTEERRPSSSKRFWILVITLILFFIIGLIAAKILLDRHPDWHNYRYFAG